jgi:hypothetical protein
MEEVGAQLRFRQLIGRGAEMSSEARDDRHVGLDGPLGVAAEMEVVDQALAQGGHEILSGKGKRGSEQRLHGRSIRRDRHDQDLTPIRRRRIEFNAVWVVTFPCEPQEHPASSRKIWPLRPSPASVELALRHGIGNDSPTRYRDILRGVAGITMTSDRRGPSVAYRTDRLSVRPSAQSTLRRGTARCTPRARTAPVPRPQRAA